MVDKVPMTQGGFVKLQEELRWRQQEERPRIIEAIAEARAHGDLSENAEYHAAKEAQSHNEGRISELEDLTARAEVIDLLPHGHASRVQQRRRPAPTAPRGRQTARASSPRHRIVRSLEIRPPIIRGSAGNALDARKVNDGLVEFHHDRDD